MTRDDDAVARDDEAVARDDEVCDDEGGEHHLSHHTSSLVQAERETIPSRHSLKTRERDFRPL